MFLYLFAFFPWLVLVVYLLFMHFELWWRPKRPSFCCYSKILTIAKEHVRCLRNEKIAAGVSSWQEKKKEKNNSVTIWSHRSSQNQRLFYFHRQPFLFLHFKNVASFSNLSVSKISKSGKREGTWKQPSKQIVLRKYDWLHSRRFWSTRAEKTKTPLHFYARFSGRSLWSRRCVSESAAAVDADVADVDAATDRGADGGRDQERKLTLGDFSRFCVAHSRSPSDDVDIDDDDPEQK